MAMWPIDKSSKEYYDKVVKEWKDSENTDELDEIMINKAWKGSGLHSMRNEKGKIIDGTSFPFDPFKF